jgi:hypothetical protein
VPPQDSAGTAAAWTAGDFALVDPACSSGMFDIARVRIQMVRRDIAPQPFFGRHL